MSNQLRLTTITIDVIDIPLGDCFQLTKDSVPITPVYEAVGKLPKSDRVRFFIENVRTQQRIYVDFKDGAKTGLIPTTN